MSIVYILKNPTIDDRGLQDLTAAGSLFIDNRRNFLTYFFNDYPYVFVSFFKS